MRTPSVLPLLLLAALALVACDQRQASTPAPTVDTARADTVVIHPGTGDPSVPAADSVLTSAAAIANPSADAAAARTNRAMTPAQESGAMPQPGQANDHSAPLTPAKPASAP